MKENTIKYLGICLDIVASTMEYQQLQSETNQKKQIARQPTKNQSTTSAKPVVDNITTTTMSTAECKRHVCNKRKQKATTNQLN